MRYSIIATGTTGFAIHAAAQVITSAATATGTLPVGSTLSNGAYVCNPAHQYPSGQSCDGSGATPTLVTLTSTLPVGSTLSNGAYVCNPAHQYPSGQSCDGSNGTPTLVTLTATAAGTPLTATAATTHVTSASAGSATVATLSSQVATYTGGAAALDSSVMGALALGLLAFFA